MEIPINDKDDKQITMKAMNVGGLIIVLTIYARNLASQRTFLWDKLKILEKTIVDSQVVMGYSNAILKATEMKEGLTLKVSQPQEFNNCVISFG